MLYTKKVCILFVVLGKMTDETVDLLNTNTPHGGSPEYMVTVYATGSA